MKKECVCDDKKEMCMCECCRQASELMEKMEEIEKQMSPHKKEKEQGKE